MKNQKKALYSLDSAIDSYEYKKMIHYFPYSLYKLYIVYSVFLSAIATALLAISCDNILKVFIIFIVILSICLIVYRFNLEKFAFKSFNKLLKKKIFIN